ncbi:M14 family metallopeptidase, partial [bacterium]|nr:M14 family metallopeptidase [bacterium]
MRKVFFWILVMVMNRYSETESFLTRAEKTQFQETSRYDETVEFCKRLEKESPWIKFSSFGKSPQGRDLPLLVVSKNQRFTADQARRSNDVVLLVINGIHAGEIAGKEASLMLARDVAVTKKHSALLDHVTLLVVPIYNVDGHECFGPYNRINQNGPKEMGWRTTSQNLNLNRDWMKLDQPETIAMLKLFTLWLPEMTIDNHVTNGADYQYDMYYYTDSAEVMPPALVKYLKGKFEPDLQSALTATGHTASLYVDLKDPLDPSAGMETGGTAPRFSNGYVTLQNRSALLSESHMLKTFQNRIRAHYDVMVATLQSLNRDFEILREAVQKADEEAKSHGAKYDPEKKVILSMKLNKEKSEPLLFKGVEYRIDESPISGGKRIQYGKTPKDFEVPWYHTLETDVAVAPPLGYIIPPQWTFVLDRLSAHGIVHETLKEQLTNRFETYRFTDVSWKEAPFEGHHEVLFKTIPVVEERSLPAGSIVVWLNQRTSKVILHLLEPDGPDSLLRWGFFNAIFEQKEYAEGYVLEQLAEEMLS